ncbi:uncharacterized protein J3D65DRAFT_356658 [Phyllosticta citribraziliensis]|uniref:Uncharacterized protein n=1 Tax=Phyllosticta citribraziliensis TaxID=989973 RepID=A0ABR1LQ66_9PEZI
MRWVFVVGAGACRGGTREGRVESSRGLGEGCVVLSTSACRRKRGKRIVVLSCHLRHLAVPGNLAPSPPHHTSSTTSAASTTSIPAPIASSTSTVRQRQHLSLPTTLCHTRAATPTTSHHSHPSPALSPHQTRPQLQQRMSAGVPLPHAPSSICRMTAAVSCPVTSSSQAL